MLHCCTAAMLQCCTAVHHIDERKSLSTLLHTNRYVLMEERGRHFAKFVAARRIAQFCCMAQCKRSICTGWSAAMCKAAR